MFFIKPLSCGWNDNIAKSHYTSTKEIANEVLNDLNSRFSKMEIEEIPNKDMYWDPGGMLMLDDEILSFDLGGMVIKCRAQHLDYLSSMLKERSVRSTDVSYYKIHSQFFCVCISPKEFDKLVEMINSKENKDKANRSIEEKERRLSEVVKQKHIVRVAKDITGNLIDVDKLVAKNNEEDLD